MLKHTLDDLDGHILLLTHMKEQADKETQSCRTNFLICHDRPAVLTILREQLIIYEKTSKSLGNRIFNLKHTREQMLIAAGHSLSSKPTLPDI